MASLTVKNIPDALLARLHRLADAERRSLNQQVIHLLENAGTPSWPSAPMPPARARDRRDDAPDWRFLSGLDADLRAGLREELVALWTHHSTALEGNTIAAGDTLFVLREGLTIGGHTLREHQELHGHADALATLNRALHGGPITHDVCHDLHRAILAGAPVDAMAPVGRYKREPNGTLALASDGGHAWHDYAAPGDVPELMARWIADLNRHLGAAQTLDRDGAIAVYTEIHLGLVAIHPYADGNGRLARLCANLPVLAAGYPPVVVPHPMHRAYLQALGEFSLGCGPARQGQALVPAHPAVGVLQALFADAWQLTWQLVDAYHRRQCTRG